MRILMAILAFSVSGMALAHHSRAAFDTNKTVAITGQITEYSWRNPHIYIGIEGAGPSGETHKWLLEANSVTNMRRNGWDAATLKQGDLVTVSGNPDRNPDKYFMLLDYVRMPDGSRLYAFKSNAGDNQPAAKIEPSSNFSGTWAFDTSSFDLKLAGGPPPADWPYTAKALADIAAFNYDQNPENKCAQIGVPRIIIYPYSINWFRDTKRIRIDKEHLDEKRTIWLNAELADFADQPASYVGTSVGHFVSPHHLVVKSDNFLPTKWGTANGVNSSAQKTVIEDYVLADDGMSMSYAITVTDPVYLTAPVVQKGSFNKAANRDFVENPCDPVSASRHLAAE